MKRDDEVRDAMRPLFVVWALVVFIGLSASAWALVSLLTSEPAGAEGPYRKREVCVCREVKR